MQQTGARLNVEVPLRTTVSLLKNKIQERTGILSARQSISFGDRVLNDDAFVPQPAGSDERLVAQVQITRFTDHSGLPGAEKPLDEEDVRDRLPVEAAVRIYNFVGGGGGGGEHTHARIRTCAHTHTLTNPHTHTHVQKGITTYTIFLYGETTVGALKDVLYANDGFPRECIRLTRIDRTPAVKPKYPDTDVRRGEYKDEDQVLCEGGREQRILEAVAGMRHVEEEHFRMTPDVEVILELDMCDARARARLWVRVSTRALRADACLCTHSTDDMLDKHGKSSGVAFQVCVACAPLARAVAHALTRAPDRGTTSTRRRPPSPWTAA